MFYLNSTIIFGIPPVLVFQLEVYYKVDRLLTGLTAQEKGTPAQWYTNETSLWMIVDDLENRTDMTDNLFCFLNLSLRSNQESLKKGP